MGKITSIDDFAIMAKRYEMYKNGVQMLNEIETALSFMPKINIGNMMTINDRCGNIHGKFISALLDVINDSREELKNEFSELIQKEYGEENKR